jgi:ferredoxin-NADP reductase
LIQLKTQYFQWHQRRNLCKFTFNHRPPAKLAYQEHLKELSEKHEKREEFKKKKIQRELVDGKIQKNLDNKFKKTT